MKKPIALIAASVLLAFSNTHAEPYRVGYNNWIGYIAYFVAQQNGDFKKAGLEVEGKSFDAPGDGLVPLLAGDLDAHLTTADAVILRSAPAPDAIRIVYLTDTSAGADALIGSAKIKTAADLKGHSVGVTFGECGQLLLGKALASAGLTEADVKLTNLSPDAAGTALKAGQIDAAVTWEPWITQIIGDGGHVVYSTKETPNLILDCLAVTPATLKNKAAATKKFIAVMDKATRFVLDEPKKAAALVAPLLNLPTADIEGMLGKLVLYDAAGSRKQMTGPALTSALEIATFFKTSAVTPTLVETKPLFDTSVLP